MPQENCLGGQKPELQEAGSWPALVVEGCRAVLPGQAVGLGRSRHFLRVMGLSLKDGGSSESQG